MFALYLNSESSFPVDDSPETEGHGDDGPPWDADRDYGFGFGETQ